MRFDDVWGTGVQRRIENLAEEPSAQPPSRFPAVRRPIAAPVYRNERIRSFQLWYVDNEPALSQYWDELGQALCERADQSTGDFFEFVAVQHEREERRLLESA